MKTWIYAAALAATVSATVPAVAGGPLDTRRFSFTDEATGYHVTARKSAVGTLYLRGEHPATGETFKLTVSRDGLVEGTWEGETVAYTIDEQKYQELASR
ncbi:hypothetical protein B5C34_05920 [Pacificimonas flava]|uniref:Uncharacterized protein n=2 Tax=Pacificimonas TaxID=1960290 RepID=A0A219B4E7_9SPHN|nr:MULTISPECIES: hypothetical protein [Pacificimonas]MBZ6377240.1 hypothetical protein [Pacificimonas aurantium]OWV33044.1 hypothetical protein B5C34_05920 [Pacificimonas flava]